MATGTPLDLTPYGAVLWLIPLLYWAVPAFLIWRLVRGRRTRQAKITLSVMTIVLFAAPMAWPLWVSVEHRRTTSDVANRFNELCKSAGEQIRRHVSDVPGIVWLKGRDEPDLGDQWALKDPYGWNCHRFECVRQLLRITKGEELNPARARPYRSGYEFVEAKDPETGRWYRYTASIRQSMSDVRLAEHLKQIKSTVPEEWTFQIAYDRAEIEQPSAPYGLTWEDISSRADRQLWIAGGSLKAIDMRTSEVIAERRGFMYDPALGRAVGTDSDPWSRARLHGPRCPTDRPDALAFALKVLAPRR